MGATTKENSLPAMRISISFDTPSFSARCSTACRTGTGMTLPLSVSHFARTGSAAGLEKSRVPSRWTRRTGSGFWIRNRAVLWMASSAFLASVMSRTADNRRSRPSCRTVFPWASTRIVLPFLRNIRCSTALSRPQKDSVQYTVPVFRVNKPETSINRSGRSKPLILQNCSLTSVNSPFSVMATPSKVASASVRKRDSLYRALPRLVCAP